MSDEITVPDVIEAESVVVASPVHQFAHTLTTSNSAAPQMRTPPQPVHPGGYTPPKKKAFRK